MPEVSAEAVSRQLARAIDAQAKVAQAAKDAAAAVKPPAPPAEPVEPTR